MPVQFNSVSRFGGAGHLLSFYCPYVCQACGTYFEELIDLRHQHAALTSGEVPSARCPRCSGEGTFDDIAESYFYYPVGKPAPRPPPQVDLYLSKAVRAAVPFRVEKDVTSEVTALWLSGTLDRTVQLKRVAAGLDGDIVLIGQGLATADDEGLARLRNFFESCTSPLSLARFPEGILRGLGAEPATGREGTEVIEVRGWGPWAPLTWSGPQRVPPSIHVYLDEHGQAPIFDSGDGASAPEATRFGRYELGERLGTGGMAEVFLARQIGLGGFEKKVVLKRILPHLSHEEAFLRMFLDEARLAARISHPNVVEIYDVGQVSQCHFIAMEHVPGADLAQLLRMSRLLQMPVPVPICAYLMAEVCAGLSAAHGWTDETGKRRPIIHRDVSPHNVLVSFHGDVKLSDFGIAKAADSAASTPTSAIKGKLAFLAPELVDGSKTSGTEQSDLFALGVVLYQCLTGVQPFLRETEFQTLSAIIKEDPLPPSSLRPGIPPELERIVARALQRDPLKRCPSAVALGADLQRFNATESEPGGRDALRLLMTQMDDRARQLGFRAWVATPTSTTGSFEAPAPGGGATADSDRTPTR